jgi:hypothetical protein
VVESTLARLLQRNARAAGRLPRRIRTGWPTHPARTSLVIGFVAVRRLYRLSNGSVEGGRNTYWRLFWIVASEAWFSTSASGQKGTILTGCI